jgi:hypothetical protein
MHNNKKKKKLTLAFYLFFFEFSAKQLAILEIIQKKRDTLPACMTCSIDKTNETDNKIKT